MSRLDFILEELVTANRILANEGVVDSFGHVSARHPEHPQRYLLVARSRPRAHRARRHRRIYARRHAGRRARPRALSRTLHPRRHLRDAAGCACGRAQPLAERDPVRRHREKTETASAHVRLDRPRGADLGFAGKIRRHDAAGNGYGHGPRSGAPHRLTPDGADARPWRHRRRPLGASRRLRLGLSRSRRQAADAGDGDGDGRDKIPQRPARSTRSSRTSPTTRSTAPGRTGRAAPGGRCRTEA